MIRVRLRAEANALKLAAKLSEELAPRGILPVINGSDVILDDTDSEAGLTPEEALPILRKSLKDAEIPYRFISVKGGEITVEDEGGGRRRPEGGAPKGLLTCPHCGFTTPYEEEYWVHLKIHYFGF